MKCCKGNRQWTYEVLGSHRGTYEDLSLLGCMPYRLVISYPRLERSQLFLGRFRPERRPNIWMYTYRRSKLLTRPQTAGVRVKCKPLREVFWRASVTGTGFYSGSWIFPSLPFHQYSTFIHWFDEYVPCITLQYVYKPTRCTKFLWLVFIFH